MNRLRVFWRAALAAVGLFAVSSAVLRAQQNQQPPPPSPSPVIARIEGRSITQDDFDRIAKPYFDRLRAEMKAGFTEDVKKLASHNVLDELIRRELLVIEAQRQKVPVSELDTDRILHQDAFFYTNGKFDQGKFVQYKLNPATNYLAVLPRIRELAGAGKLDSLVRMRLAPPPAAVRAEWSKRNDQVDFKFLHLALREISLDPESGQEEWAAYYAAHSDQFERKPKIRLRYVSVRVPPEGDSQRDSIAASAMVRGQGLADSLRRGISIDTLGRGLDGVQDTGLIDFSSGVFPGLGRVPELAIALAGAESDTTIRVAGPVLAGEGVVIGEIVERLPKSLPPMREVLADVKRRADAEKRRTTNESDRHAYFEAHRDAYRTGRAHVTRVVLMERMMAAKPPAKKEIETTYQARGRALVALPDTALLPTLTDSLRRVVGERLEAEARAAAAARTLAPIAQGWQAGRDPRTLARTTRAYVETLSVDRGAPTDSLFPPSLVDTFFTNSAAVVGRVEGPRGFGGRAVVWRVEAVDTTIVPTFEAVRSRVEQEFIADKRRKDEADGQAWYEAHRADYKTKPKFIVDYVVVKIPPVDSVRIAEAELRRHYDKNQETYRQEEQVRARHILVGTRPGQTLESVARRRADSLRTALEGGADFADLARRFSQDPGSGQSGGDLGWFARGRMVKEFSDTSFALEIGRVSQPVKTQFGYHLIRVDEKKAAGVRPFDEVRDEIRRRLAQSRGDSTARRSAEGLRRRLVRGEAVALVAKSSGGLLTSSAFAANEPITGVGLVTGLGQDVDSLRVGRWASKTYKASESYVLVRLKQRVPSAQAEFSEVRIQTIEDAKNAKKKEILAAKVAAIRQRLTAGASLDSVAALYGGLKDSGPLTQNAGFVPSIGPEQRMITKAFAMKKGQVSDTLTTAQGFAWIRVEERKTLQGSSFAKDQAAIATELQQKKYVEWLEKKKQTMKIEVLRADLREKPKPLTQTFTVDR